MTTPDPKDLRDGLDRLKAVQMEMGASRLKIAAGALRAAVASRRLHRAFLRAESAEFWSHPDVLEADVATTQWYPEAVRALQGEA